MTPQEISLFAQILTVIVFLAAIISPVITSIVTGRQAEKERQFARWRIETELQEARSKDQAEREAAKRREETEIEKSVRRAEREYLLGILRSLVQLRAKLQFLQGVELIRDHYLSGDYVKAVREREEAYGEAFGLIFSTGKSQFEELAEAVMNPELSPHEKLTAINNAIKSLAATVTRFDY